MSASSFLAYGEGMWCRQLLFPVIYGIGISGVCQEIIISFQVEIEFQEISFVSKLGRYYLQ